MSNYEWERDEANWLRHTAERTDDPAECMYHRYRLNYQDGQTCVVCGAYEEDEDES